MINFVMVLFIGTSGFSYKDWYGVFYPPELPKDGMLAFYASVFPFVELNFTYYTLPVARNIEGMADKTPADFLFTVKAHKSQTHEQGPNWLDETARFIDGIAPLRDGGKLGAVLFQFPFSFHYTKGNRIYLDKVLNACRDLPKVVEFRNSEWQKDEVYSGLTTRNTGIVLTDSPAIEGLPSFEKAEATSSLGYLRFHGRNSSDWWTGDNVSRYDYLYSPEELQSWEDRILDLIKKVKLLFIAFNNHHKGQAVKNALQLTEMLKHPT